MNDVHYSSASNEWQTPDWLFDRLNREFAFDLDAAATAENAKCGAFMTAEMDALSLDWGARATSVWINPPYGRIGPRFIAKAHEQTSVYANLTVVLLVPARPDTISWHAHCTAGEIRFLKGRVAFVQPGSTGKPAPAPFPSAIVVFGKRARAGQVFHVDYSPDDAPPPETVTIPVVPPEGLLESMATRLDHAFGLSAGMTDEQIEQMRNSPNALDAAIARGQWLTSAERAARLVSMAQVHEEVVGKGFYRYAAA
jgi:phage N-6-adenine-methyltransferase